jgi:[ribosomal protein S5]-alanine N-acetyltransferase
VIITPPTELRTPRLILEPLTVAHADAMFDVLSDPTIYEYLDYGPPPSREHLQGVYLRLAHGESPDGQEGWFNWIVTHPERGPMGVVQATVLAPHRTAWVAYVLAQPHRGFGFAREATAAMIEHLINVQGMTTLLAMIEDANEPSRRLLLSLGFAPAQAIQQGRWGTGMTPTERLLVRDS